VKTGGRKKIVQSGFAARLSWQFGMTGVVVVVGFIVSGQ